MNPDGFTLAGQRKRCSKTLPAFLSDATRAFAASMPLTRRSRTPQHSFNAGKSLYFKLIGFVSGLTAGRKSGN
ncbi:hypothetical protein EXT70_21090 [Dickeya dadantii]|nr:hypothetical protein [Dickeya dadantii]